MTQLPNPNTDIPFPESFHNPLLGRSFHEEAGVEGRHNRDGSGVTGFSQGGRGVTGISLSGDGVFGQGATNGIHGEASKPNHSGVWANNSGGGYGVAGTSDAPGGIGVYARGGKLAGKFEGDVEVTGDISLVNADCAEDFDIADLKAVEPGTVMVIDSEGALRPSDQPYDKRVAGVISGAGKYKPALILDKQESKMNRMPIALMGKVYCKVDASYGAIEVGDLLTTSPTSGYAMKATDSLRAFGAVIGKALRPLSQGQELIPILIALQ